MILSIFWFCYLLAVFCIIDVAFNGAPGSRVKTGGIIPIEFATAWDLRVQFYPLTILIVLPTLPFVYLLSKIFKSDIIVRTWTWIESIRRFHSFVAGWPSDMCSTDHSALCQYHRSHHNDGDQ